MQWEGWAVLVVMLIALVLLYSEFRPPDVVLLGALAVVWNLGIIETKDAIDGFSNSSLVTVGALFIVVEGVDKAKLVDKVARRCLGKKTSETGALLRLCSLGLAFSGFFNNTPLVALLMPILRDWARSRNFAPSKFLIPLSFSTIGGGLMTIIGTSTNLVIIGMMTNSGSTESFSFFDPAKVGGPVSLLALFYLLTVGRRLLPDNRGGMFREVAEHTAAWLTELHVTDDFPLVDENLWEVMDYLGIPKESLKKVFRIRKESEQWEKLNRKASVSVRSLVLNASPFSSRDLAIKEGNDRIIVSLDEEWSPEPRPSINSKNGALGAMHCVSFGGVSFASTKEASVKDFGDVDVNDGDVENCRRQLSPDSNNSKATPSRITLPISVPAINANRIHYRDRTEKYFGASCPSSRSMTMNLQAVCTDDSSGRGPPMQEDVKEYPTGSSMPTNGISSKTSFADLGDDAIIEIGPVTEHTHAHMVLHGGDTLVLGLPIKECLNLLQSNEISQRLKNLMLSSAAPGLSRCPEEETPVSNATNLSDKSSLTEKAVQRVMNSLQIENVNFLDLPGWKDEFVELVLSAKNPFVGEDWGRKARRDFEDHYQVSVIAVRHSGEPSVESGDLSRSISGVLRDTMRKNERRKENGVESKTKSENSLRRFNRMRERTQKLRPGDTILVLAKSGEKADRLKGPDFLTITRVGHERKGGAHPLDYVPLVLFIAALTMVALQVIPMVQASIALAIIFIFGGWVEAKRIRECVDWNLMILIGSALGLSAAVRESGLSQGVASLVKSANLGPWGSVYLLYFFTMVITELVTNNAAAALGYPLAVDLTRIMGLKSTKPLVMTVMLAASTSYASPIGYATNLMVLGPGGYSFSDFFKVGLPMDIIYWLGCSTFLPVIWPLETV